MSESESTIYQGKQCRIARTVAEANAQVFELPENYDEWQAFAHLLNGYLILEDMGIEDWSEWWQQRSMRFNDTGTWVGEVIELRRVLFFKARSERFSYSIETINDFVYIDRLLATIAEKTGLPYQSDLATRDGLTKATDELKNLSLEERARRAGLELRFDTQDEKRPHSHKNTEPTDEEK